MPCVPGLMPCRAHRVYFFRMTRPHATPKRRAANGTPRECRSSGRPCAEPAGLHCRDGRSPVPSRGRPCAERQSPVPNPRRSSSLHFFPQRGSTANRDKMPLPTFARVCPRAVERGTTRQMGPLRGPTCPRAFVREAVSKFRNHEDRRPRRSCASTLLLGAPVCLRGTRAGPRICVGADAP